MSIASVNIESVHRRDAENTEEAQSNNSFSLRNLCALCVSAVNPFLFGELNGLDRYSEIFWCAAAIDSQNISMADSIWSFV